VTDPIVIMRRELVAAAERESVRRGVVPGVRPRVRLLRRGRPALVLAAALVLASGTAVAATQLFGPPVRAGLVLTGAPKPGQALLLPLRAADPAGGFPWGVRIYTRRLASAAGALSCLQVGRVLDGELGVIGEDGAFGDDGLFHALPVEPLRGCAQAGAASWYPEYVSASAYTGSGTCAAPLAGLESPASRSRDLTRGARACPTSDLRLVVYGIASRQAKAVRLAGSFGVDTQRLVRADHGAFIFVLPAAGLATSRLDLRVTFPS
jgi:hypothetical protein